MSVDHVLNEVHHGSVYAGSPETVAQKIARAAKALRLSRFDLKYSNGTLAHGKTMKSIELIGKEVMPRVKAGVAEMRRARAA